MARTVTLIRLFAASPSGLDAEREGLQSVVDEVNRTWSQSLGVYLELVRWETHSYPSFGNDPQDVINTQVDDNFDIFIGILSHRFGTPTPRAGSGTEEEFERALARFNANHSAIKILMYFKSSQVDLGTIDPPQLAKVLEFKKKLGGKGSLYWEYPNADSFVAFVRVHIARAIQDFGKLWGQIDGPDANQPSVTPNLAPASQSTESGNPKHEGFLDLMEEAASHIGLAGVAINAIVARQAQFNEMMSAKTAVFAVLPKASEPGNLKEWKMQSDAVGAEINLMATFLDEKARTIQAEYTLGCDSFSRAISLSLDYGVRAIPELEGLAIVLENLAPIFASVVPSIEGFSRGVRAVPRATSALAAARQKLLDSLELFVSVTKGVAVQNDQLVNLVGDTLLKLRAEQSEQG